MKGRFGTALLQVKKIEPGEEKTYEQMAAQIKTEIAEARAKSGDSSCVTRSKMSGRRVRL